MATFKDAKNREWTVSLDAPKIRDVRARLEVDLIDVQGKAIGELADNFCLLVDVLWVLCEKQAQTKNIKDSDFGESLVGDALMHAVNALTDAIIDFFPPDRREVLRTVASKMAEVRTVGMETALAKINNPTLATKIRAQIESEVDAALNKWIPSSPATNSPASAESDPTA